MDPQKIPGYMPEHLSLPEDVSGLCDRIQALVEESPLLRVEKVGALEAVKHALLQHYMEDQDDE